MKIETITVGAFDQNCYLLYNPESREAMVVDPGADAQEIAGHIKRRNLTVTLYLITHGHADHLTALADLCAKHPAPFMIHPADAAWAFEAVNQIPPYYGVPHRPNTACLAAEDGTEHVIGSLAFRVVGTPGHTPGGVCYYFFTDGALISGDTLFQGSVGRTDLPGGDPRILTQSLNKLKRLPPETWVYPGHGAPTTIEDECASNIYMRGRV